MPAPPLTVDTVMRAVQTVRDWRVFGVWLFPSSDDPDHKLDAIQQQYSSEKDRLHAIVQEWLKGYQPSWRRLILALDQAAESTLANPLRKYAEPPQGDSICCISRIWTVKGVLLIIWTTPTHH